MIVTIEALDAWWPPTLRPVGLGRTRLAASTIAVASHRTRCSTSLSACASSVLLVASTGSWTVIRWSPRLRGRTAPSPVRGQGYQADGPDAREGRCLIGTGPPEVVRGRQTPATCLAIAATRVCAALTTLLRALWASSYATTVRTSLTSVSFLIAAMASVVVRLS